MTATATIPSNRYPAAQGFGGAPPRAASPPLARTWADGGIGARRAGLVRTLASEMVTPGVLVRRLQRDPNCRVGAIILDEVHERHSIRTLR